MAKGRRLQDADRRKDEELQLSFPAAQRGFNAPSYLERGFPLKSAISKDLQNLMLSGISGMSRRKKKRHERNRGLGRAYCVENGTPSTSLRHSKTNECSQPWPHDGPLCSTVKGKCLFQSRSAEMWCCGARSSDLTIAGDVQFHQLHEVGHLGGKSLDLIVTQAQFTEVQKPKERLGQKENKSGSAELREQFSPLGKPKYPSSPPSACPGEASKCTAAQMGTPITVYRDEGESWHLVRLT